MSSMQKECGMKERQSGVSFSCLALVGKLESFSGCELGIHPSMAQSSLHRCLYTWWNAQSPLFCAYVFLGCCEHGVYGARFLVRPKKRCEVLKNESRL